jgi:hypothetical protein
MAFLASLGVPPGCAHQVSSRTRQARQGGMVSPAITPARPLRQGRAGDPCVRVAGGWLARTGSLPAGLPVESTTGTGAWPPPSASSRPAPTWSSCPWTARPRQLPPCTADQVHQPVEAVHARRGHGDHPQLAAARAAVAAGSMPGARVPAGARPGPGHDRRWGRPWWRPWPCWSPGTASGRPPGWAALASAEGRAGLAERREAAQASVRSWPMGRGAALRRDRLRRRLAAVTGGGCWASPAPVSWPRGPGRLPAGPPRPPVRTRGQGGGVAHQLATPHP